MTIIQTLFFVLGKHYASPEDSQGIQKYSDELFNIALKNDINILNKIADDYSNISDHGIDILAKAVDQKEGWELEGLCNTCGAKLISENVGYTAPDPEKYVWSCANCNF